MSTLELHKVTKECQNGDGIRDITLKLNSSTIYSVIGPNGSGKTTLLKSIMGLTRIDSGKILLDNRDTNLRECKKKIGYAVDEQEIYPNMTILELLNMVRGIKYQGKYVDEQEELLEAFELWDYRNRLFQKCSLGMKKKVGIIISLLGNPSLVLLDEPTNGVDTNGIITLKKHLYQVKERGGIVLLACHMLDFVKNVSDKNIFLRNGEIIKITEDEKNLDTLYKTLYLLM